MPDQASPLPCTAIFYVHARYIQLLGSVMTSAKKERKKVPRKFETSRNGELEAESTGVSETSAHLQFVIT